jgi:hypothetical protein
VNLTWGVSVVNIGNAGLGFTSIPTVVFSSGAAAATAVLEDIALGNPQVPGFFQQRLVLAAPLGSPQTFYMSKPGQYYNFNQSSPLRPDDSIIETLTSGVLNTIKAVVSSTAGMLLLTDSAAVIVNGGSPGSAISTSNIVANFQSYIGANDIRPIVANFDVLFVQQKGTSVRDMTFNIYFNIFTGTDISILPSHLFFGHQIKDWAWAEEPFKVAWAIRDDGVLLSLTFMKEQEFIAWAHHVTDGTYESVAAVTEPDEVSGNTFVDGTYLAVQRTITIPPPPATCGVWTPAAFTSMNVSAHTPNGSVQGDMNGSNWTWNGVNTVPANAFFSVSTSSYVTGSIVDTALTGPTSSQLFQWVVSGGAAFGLVQTVGYDTARVDLTTGALTISSLALPSGDAVVVNKGCLHGGFVYAVTQKALVKFAVSNIATQTVIQLTSLFADGSNKAIVLDATNNRIFVVPSRSNTAPSTILVVDLTNFTLGGITSINMSTLSSFGGVDSRFINGFCDATNLYIGYDDVVTGDLLFAYLNLGSLTVTKTVDLDLCNFAGMSDVYSDGTNAYVLHDFSGDVSVFRIHLSTGDLSAYYVTGVDSNVTKAATWVWDGSSTLYVQPGATGVQYAFRITP